MAIVGAGAARERAGAPRCDGRAPPARRAVAVRARIVGVPRARPPRRRAGADSRGPRPSGSSRSRSKKRCASGCAAAGAPALDARTDRGGRRPRHRLGCDRARARGRAARREVWATDASADALAVARRERRRLRGDARAARRRLVVRRAAARSLRGELALVVANPPYVAEPEVESLPRRGRAATNRATRS